MSITEKNLLVKNFKSAYHKVFDFYGNRKNVSTNTLKRLILSARKLNNTKSYGNTESGYIDVIALKVLYYNLA